MLNSLQRGVRMVRPWLRQQLNNRAPRGMPLEKAWMKRIRISNRAIQRMLLPHREKIQVLPLKGSEPAYHPFRQTAPE